MQMPTPTEHHARLARLSGVWQGDETLHPAPPWRPQPSTAHGRMHLRMDLSGFFLVSDYIERQGDVVTYAGHGVYGYDGKASTYTMHWFDNMGGFYQAPARGAFDGDRLEFRLATAEFEARYVYELLADGSMTFRIDTARGHAPGTPPAWVPFMDGRYRRVA